VRRPRESVDSERSPELFPNAYGAFLQRDLDYVVDLLDVIDRYVVVIALKKKKAVRRVLPQLSPHYFRDIPGHVFIRQEDIRATRIMTKQS